MKAEQLFVKASARGIDLKQLAVEATNFYGAGSPRRKTLMERLSGLPVKETATGKQSRVTRRGYYSHAELGLALAGLEGAPYLAARYSFILDGAAFPALYRKLRSAAAKMADEESWEYTVEGRGGQNIFYQDELTSMVLDVDWLKPFFVHAPGLYAVYLDVAEDVWQAKLLRKYLEILARYESWLSAARCFVDRKLYEEFHRDDEMVAPVALVG